jgi:hypothetical protein
MPTQYLDGVFDRFDTSISSRFWQLPSGMPASRKIWATAMRFSSSVQSVALTRFW